MSNSKKFSLPPLSPFDYRGRLPYEAVRNDVPGGVFILRTLRFLALVVGLIVPVIVVTVAVDNYEAETGILIAIGCVINGVMLYGLSFIVEAAIRYIKNDKRKSMSPNVDSKD